jgi:hypothetical protein
MKYRTVLITAFSLIATLGHADVIELKNGQKLTGKYAGGTASSVGFETGGGMQFFETAQVVSLSFGDSGAATLAPSAATKTSAVHGRSSCCASGRGCGGASHSQLYWRRGQHSGRHTITRAHGRSGFVQ